MSKIFDSSPTQVTYETNQVLLAGGHVVFLGDLPFSPHHTIDSAQNVGNKTGRKTQIKKKGFYGMYGSLLSIHSCPEITRDLQCWGVESPPPETPGDTPANDFDQAGDMVGPSECTMSDVIDIGKGCLDKFDYNPLSDIFNPCG